MLTLSVLEQVPVVCGCTAAEAMQETIALAQAVERLGYRRFWLAEHHNGGLLACPVPEILAAAVAANTTHIRVGSGGVLLHHYSTLKVAQTFRMLHTLFPNRIDLGVGRGLAVNPDVRKLLGLSTTSTGSGDPYAQQVQDLIGFVENGFPDDHPYGHIRVMPDGLGSPEVWLLGSGFNSVEIAASLGISFSFAQFINRHPLPKVIAAYRQRFCPSASLSEPRASLAVRVLCADSEREAQKLALSFWLVSLKAAKEKKEAPCLPSIEEASCYPYTEQDLALAREDALMMVAGDPIQVKTVLTGMAKLYGVEELVILTTCPDFKARLRSYQLLAEAFELKPVSSTVL
jgi:luciferase family oxidoreductase group 1